MLKEHFDRYRDQRFSSAQAAALISIPRPTLNVMAGPLPVTRSTGQGRARQWTIKDLVTCHVAHAVQMRGLSPAAAIDVAKATEKQFEQVIVDDEKGTKWRLLVRLNPNDIGEFESVSTCSLDAAFAFLEDDPKGTAVLNLTELVRDAFEAIRAAEIGLLSDG